jgi:hypothetical protein
VPNLADLHIDPSRMRLKRVATSWEGGEASTSVLARMTMLQHGGYNDPIITRGKKHLRIRIPSRKTGTRQMLEGPSEMFLGMDSEANWNVRDWEAHPMIFDFVYDARPMTYHLDLMRQLRDGTVECIEAKRTARDLADPDYALKLGCVAEACRRIGWQFHIRYKAEIIGSKARRRTVEKLFGQVYKQLDPNVEKTVERFVNDNMPVAWGSLRDAVAPTSRVEGNAIVCHVSTQQRLAFDLEAEVTSDTVVTPLSAPPAVATMRI